MLESDTWDVQDVALDRITLMLSNSESSIDDAAFASTLAMSACAAYRLQIEIVDNLFEKVFSIMTNDTEALVRREAIALIAKLSIDADYRSILVGNCHRGKLLQTPSKQISQQDISRCCNDDDLEFSQLIVTQISDSSRLVRIAAITAADSILHTTHRLPRAISSHGKRSRHADTKLESFLTSLAAFDLAELQRRCEPAYIYQDALDMNNRSGKTVAAELALWSAFREFPRSKVVYIAPLKALVRERVQDWRARLMFAMGRNLVELTGDVTPDLATIQNADIIVTTPEKWDGVSRGWQTRKYVTDVSLVIIDEIHLLGGDRGPILEVIVSRMKYISARTGKHIRIVGLSTALANATDLGDWLGIGNVGLFNFRHSVRPVPLEIYIEGYPGKHYCPRMISMNKPTYHAIMTHSPAKPVIVFVSSRRQTRLTAQDLISFCANDDKPRRFLHMPEEEIDLLITNVKDQSLKLALPFGIGLHHAGLIESDRKLSEELFINGKIQILVATSTLAWGVNFPAHLVVIKGTEFYDAKIKGYVDFPITDVLQMMGRAGRPQFDNSGVAVILVQDTKKNFYKKFLHEPFPVESSLHSTLHDHFNAEVAAGTIKSKQDAMDYLTWTYLYRRVRMNPTYYGSEDSSDYATNIYLSNLIEDTFEALSKADCITIHDDFDVRPTSFGSIASFYYLRYKTIGIIKSRLVRNYIAVGDESLGQYPDGNFSSLLRLLTDVAEYEEFPVRHNEDQKNMAFEQHMRYSARIPRGARSDFDNLAGTATYDSPHLKAFFLLQAHMDRLQQLPCADYHTDTISVLDQAVRVVQAMIDVAVLQGFFETTLGLTSLLQCLKQARWTTDSPLLTLPHLTNESIMSLKHAGEPITDLATLARLPLADLEATLAGVPDLSNSERRDIVNVVSNLPIMSIHHEVENAMSLAGKKNPDGSSYAAANPNDADRWIVAPAGVYTLQLKLERLRPYRPYRDNQGMFQIHSPKFPKPQTESWWAVLGDRAHNDLLALKRIAPMSDRGKDKTNNDAEAARQPLKISGDRMLHAALSFEAPTQTGDYEFDIMLISDGYRGLDVCTKLKLRVD
eukprot:jgi/Hompol1/329/HPOL_001394-RA